MKKKGMLFTLGLSIVALVVLVLSIVIFNNFQTSEERFSNIMVFGRVYDLDHSIQEGIKKIFDEKAAISLEGINNVVTIGEDFPNPNSVDFNSKISGFKNFVESNLDNINLSIDEITSSLTLTVSPFGVNYLHEDFGDRKLVLDYNDNVSSLDFYFWDNDSNGTVNFLAITPGSLEVNIVVEAPEGWHEETSASIDPSQLSSAQITGLNEGDIELEFNQDGVSIESFTNDTVLIETTIEFISAYTEINLPNVISISFQDFGISKLGGVRVL